MALGARRDRQASVAVAAGTKVAGVARAHVIRATRAARVDTRRSTAEPVHSMRVMPEERAAAAFDTDARHASVSGIHANDRTGCGKMLAPCRSRAGPASRGYAVPESLGGRSAVRQSQQPDRNAGRARDAVRHARDQWVPKTRRRSSSALICIGARSRLTASALTRRLTGIEARSWRATKQFTLATDMAQVYFCRPRRAPWQRGSTRTDERPAQAVPCRSGPIEHLEQSDGAPTSTPWRRSIEPTRRVIGSCRTSQNARLHCAAGQCVASTG